MVQMEWRPAGGSLCLPLLIFPCTIKSRGSLLVPAHLGGPGKGAVKWLWWCGAFGPKSPFRHSTSFQGMVSLQDVPVVNND